MAAEEKNERIEESLNSSGPQEPVLIQSMPTSDSIKPVEMPKNRWAFLKRKKVYIPLAMAGAFLVIVGLLLAIPVTRYGMLAPLVKKDLILTTVDNKTGKPVSDALVTVDDQTKKTDAKGKVAFSQMRVGFKQIVIKKKYYKDSRQTITVPIVGSPQVGDIKLEATGRQVPIKVLNKITGKPVAKATILSQESTAITDANGEATIVLPVKNNIEKATIKTENYVETAVSVQVTEQKNDKNTFLVTPTGKLYFLSKRTGKINVMKSNLDGTEAEVVVAGTGKEEETNTVLLAARSWGYLALKAKRDAGNAKLYLINTADDKLTVIDEGRATFDPIGWHNNQFIYRVHRDGIPSWQPKGTALKSFNATTGKLVTLDETLGEGTGTFEYAREVIENVYILDNQIVYTKPWNASFSYGGWALLNGKKASIMSAKPTGGKSSLKDFGISENENVYFYNVRPFKPQEVYFQVGTSNSAAAKFYELEDGKVHEATDATEQTFTKFYPTYLLSPNGTNTFWTEPRDGKNTLFLGNPDGGDEKEYARLSEYVPYGWYGEDYLLVSKGGSELFIMPRTPSEVKPYKITDYHKPDFQGAGYGYGYGGL